MPPPQNTSFRIPRFRIPVFFTREYAFPQLNLDYSQSLLIFAMEDGIYRFQKHKMPTQTNTSTEFERFTKFLNSKRLRKTPERFEILRCVLETKGHFDVDNLYNGLEQRGYHVSKATIYSTLELLCASGVIRKLLFDTHQARYEHAELTHSHLVCTQCGEIKEINLEEIDSRLSAMTFPDFTPAYVSTCVYGICDKCRRKNVERTRPDTGGDNQQFE